MAEQIAAFRFIGYKIVESSIKYDPDQSDFDNLSVNIKNTTGINEEDLKLKLELELEVKNESNDLNIVVKAIGIFEFDRDLPDKHKEIFFNSSAPAILFPYIRAYITSLTALSGIQPIILPTINLSGRNNKNNQE
ncbi:MAG TPA: protein export chaperone secb [Bacteroides sp.]|jgi:preprotein translocase subunit SecB|nr:protein export chaperone secb [Bacteroides sp.]